MIRTARGPSHCGFALSCLTPSRCDISLVDDEVGCCDAGRDWHRDASRDLPRQLSHVAASREMCCNATTATTYTLVSCAAAAKPDPAPATFTSRWSRTVARLIAQAANLPRGRPVPGCHPRAQPLDTVREAHVGNLRLCQNCDAEVASRGSPASPLALIELGGGGAIWYFGIIWVWSLVFTILLCCALLCLSDGRRSQICEDRETFIGGGICSFEERCPPKCPSFFGEHLT